MTDICKKIFYISFVFLVLIDIRVEACFAQISGSPFSTGVASSPVYSLSYSPDGTKLAVTNESNNSITVFNVNTSTGALSSIFCTITIPGTSGNSSPRGISFLPTLNNIFTVVTQGGGGPVFNERVRVFDTSSCSQVQVFDTIDGSNQHSGVAYNNTGTLLAASTIANGTPGVIWLLSNPSTGVLTSSTPPFAPFVTGTGVGDPEEVCFSPNGNFLAAANKTAASVSLFNVVGTNLTFNTTVSISGVTPSTSWGVKYSPSGSCLAVSGGNKVTLFSVNPSTGALTQTDQQTVTSPARGVAFSSDGAYLAVASEAASSNIAIFTVNNTTCTLTPITPLPVPPSGTAIGVQWAPLVGSNYYLAAGFSASRVAVFGYANLISSITPAPTASVVEGGYIVFSSTTSGGVLPYTAFQWFKNGSPISGATMSTYSIFPAVPGDAGNYSLRVTDFCGIQSTSPQTALSVTAKSLSVYISGSSAICYGNPTILTAIASGGVPPYSYLWSPGGQTVDNITVSTPGTYMVTVTDNNSVMAQASRTVYAVN